jgi:hypothetical protein
VENSILADPKDFVDLYFVLRNYALKLNELINTTQSRFEIKGLEFIIPERLLLVRKIGPSDLPTMLQEINLEEMKSYFLTRASELVKSLRKDKAY